MSDWNDIMEHEQQIRRYCGLSEEDKIEADDIAMYFNRSRYNRNFGTIEEEDEE